MASRVLVVIGALVFIHCVFGSQLVERQLRELFSRREQLNNLRRLVNEWDQQLSHIQKRTCDSSLNIPGSRDGCEALNAQNNRWDREYLKNLNSPGKRNVCALGLGGFMDGCDAQSAMEALKAREFFNSLQSPGKRQAESDNNSEASPRN
uniref:Uncharacterized protein n=1 Tax=Strigamia maritima TaxID=126957 RepID=T1JEV7_STRMM